MANSLCMIIICRLLTLALNFKLSYGIRRKFSPHVRLWRVKETGRIIIYMTVIRTYVMSWHHLAEQFHIMITHLLAPCHFRRAILWIQTHGAFLLCFISIIYKSRKRYIIVFRLIYNW